MRETSVVSRPRTIGAMIHSSSAGTGGGGGGTPVTLTDLSFSALIYGIYFTRRIAADPAAMGIRDIHGVDRT